MDDRVIVTLDHFRLRRSLLGDLDNRFEFFDDLVFDLLGATVSNNLDDRLILLHLWQIDHLCAHIYFLDLLYDLRHDWLRVEGINNRGASAVYLLDCWFPFLLLH